ncbi:MAG: AbrB/MazE/SpoVT family DNA-binding domain-containing protein [Nitrososphaerales archaeon]
MEEPATAVVGTKGQIVIPQQLRRELKIKPKTKLAVYRKEDKLVIVKLKIPSLDDKLDSLFRDIDKKYKEKKRPTVRETLEEIQAYRRERRTNKGT